MDQDPPFLDLSPQNMMLTTLKTYSRFCAAVSDLKVCIASNRTKMDFITSDDPVCITSRLHAQKLKSNSFGVGSAGVIFFFPMSPRLLLVCFDGDVYSARNKNRHIISIVKERDISSCNELQYMNARNNLYFADWSERCLIDRNIGTVKGRPSFRTIISKFVEEEELEFGTRFRELGDLESPQGDGILIQLSQTRAFPSSWMSTIAFRRKVKLVDTGSAAGPVRQHTWNDRDG